MLQQRRRQPPHLLRRLSQPEDDFRKAFTNGAMMVDLGEPKILKRRGRSLRYHLIRVETAGLEVIEEFI